MIEEDIKGDLEAYLSGIKRDVYNDVHCAIVYMLHLECDLCRLRFNRNSECMSNPIWCYVK